MRFVFHLVTATAIAIGLAGCGVTNPSDLRSETFSDSVATASISNTFFFSTSGTGEFTVKMTALTPDNGATLTAYVGIPTTVGGVQSCNVQYSAGAGLNRTFFDQQLPKGDWCFQMVDPTGALPRTQTFTVVISHL
jgi:hypothetical protein